MLAGPSRGSLAVPLSLQHQDTLEHCFAIFLVCLYSQKSSMERQRQVWEGWCGEVCAGVWGWAGWALALVLQGLQDAEPFCSLWCC